MSFKKKYLFPVFIFLAVYTFNSLFYQCGELVFIYSYTYLSETVPSIVDTVNPIHTPEKYELYLKAATTVGAFIGLFFINYVALRMDNEKFEYIITKTDGQYRLSDGIKLYLSEFWVSDVIASTVTIGTLTVCACFVPDEWLDKGLILLFKLCVSLIEFYGPVWSVLIGILFSILTRVVAIPLCVRTWRALWLSGSV